MRRRQEVRRIDLALGFLLILMMQINARWVGTNPEMGLSCNPVLPVCAESPQPALFLRFPDCSKVVPSSEQSAPSPEEDSAEVLEVSNEVFAVRAVLSGGSSGAGGKEDDLPPIRLLLGNPPPYTAGAIRGGVEGLLVVYGEVRSDGRFEVFSVDFNLDAELSHEAVRTITQEWQANPILGEGTLRGRPFTVEIEYRLFGFFRDNRQSLQAHLGLDDSAASWLIIPKPLQFPPIPVTQSAAASGLSGEYVVKANIRPDGTIESAVLAADPGHGLGAAVLAHITRLWIFRPSILEGDAFGSWVELKVSFSPGTKDGRLLQIMVNSQP